MLPTQRSGAGTTDIAALSAAIVAVALSMFLSTGPFDILGAMVAVTLSFLIYGYVWEHSRSVSQSLAVAAILGVIAVPIFGFLYELWFAPDRFSHLTRGEPVRCPDGSEWKACKDQLRSQLTQIGHVVIWAVIGTMAFVADRRNQK